MYWENIGLSQGTEQKYGWVECRSEERLPDQKTSAKTFCDKMT